MEHPDLSQLILDGKGKRSYERLSRDCGGTPTAKRLQQLASSPIKSFPETETIEGIARGLSATVSAVVLAAARSLGLDVYEGSDPGALMLAGGAELTSDQREAVLAVVRAFRRHNKADEVTNAQRVALEELGGAMGVMNKMIAGRSNPAEASAALRAVLGASGEVLTQTQHLQEGGLLAPDADANLVRAQQLLAAMGLAASKFEEMASSSASDEPAASVASLDDRRPELPKAPNESERRAAHSRVKNPPEPEVD